MGRKKEFVASKSFTLGLQELVYMEKKCNEDKVKASAFINRLLRRAMIEDQKKEEEQHGPVTWCTECGTYKEFKPIHHEDGCTWNCMVCEEDKTAVIEYQLANVHVK